MVASEFTDLPKGTLYQLKAAFERRRPEVQGRAHDAHVAYEAYMRDVDTCSQSSSEVEDAMEETLDEAMRQCDAAEQLVIKCEQLTNELLRSADTLRQAVKSAQSTQESSSPVDQRTHSSSASSV
jgi:methyl-accepting chemotaxis protein